MSKYRETISREEFEQIERYLLDSMDTAEKELFEVKLSRDEMLLNEVILQRQLLAAVETGTFTAKRKSPQQVLSPTIPFRKWASYRRYAAVVVFMVGAGFFGWWYYTAEPDQYLYNAYFRPDLGLPVVMGIDSTKYLFNEGMVSYKEGKYEDAINVWRGLELKNGKTDTLQYYIGVAHLNRGNPAVASDYLEPVKEDEASVFRDKAIWYLALLKLKEKEYSSAKQLLKQLPEKNEAIELLEKISD